MTSHIDIQNRKSLFFTSGGRWVSDSLQQQLCWAGTSLSHNLQGSVALGKPLHRGLPRPLPPRSLWMPSTVQNQPRTFQKSPSIVSLPPSSLWRALSLWATFPVLFHWIFMPQTRDVCTWQRADSHKIQGGLFIYKNSAVGLRSVECFNLK